MPEYTIQALTPDTWDAFARLAEKHNGVWGGCWCMGFHPEGVGRDKTVEQNRSEKEARVRGGQAHAALVFDGDDAVAWAEYGTPDELPNIYHRKQYLAGAERAPDYRITCFFVDRNYRRHGMSGVALRGALDLIARAGGGVVEGYPHDVAGQKLSSSFLYNGTRTLFENAGFVYDRPKGPRNCVMRTTVAGAPLPQHTGYSPL